MDKKLKIIWKGVIDYHPIATGCEKEGVCSETENNH